jgi:hypothetical protein
VDDAILGEHVERRGWFRRDTLTSIVDVQRRGGGHDYVVWTLLVLELWLRATLDETRSEATRPPSRREAYA